MNEPYIGRYYAVTAAAVMAFDCEPYPGPVSSGHFRFIRTSGREPLSRLVGCDAASTF